MHEWRTKKEPNNGIRAKIRKENVLRWNYLLFLWVTWWCCYSCCCSCRSKVSRPTDCCFCCVVLVRLKFSIDRMMLLRLSVESFLFLSVESFSTNRMFLLNLFNNWTIRVNKFFWVVWFHAQSLTALPLVSETTLTRFACSCGFQHSLNPALRALRQPESARARFARTCGFDSGCLRLGFQCSRAIPV